MPGMLTQWRRRVGAFIGGFEAGLANRRLKGFQPSRAHLNTLIAAAGADITARARWLIRNNGYAANAIESWAGNVVGAGIKPSSLIADAALKATMQKLWLDWTDDADADGFTDFYGLQRRATREVFITGEVFFRFRPRRPEDGLQVPLQLQMLPAEMLPLNRNEVLPGGTVIRQGIEFDRIGRRVAYHFLRRHPGDVTDPGLVGETVRIPASEIIHVIDPVDAGQLRGVSKFAPAIVKLFLLDQYDDAELDRKKVAAMHALFITTPAPAEPFDAQESTGENGERTLDLQPGQIVMLEPGEQVQTSDPADSGATYEPFQYRTLLQVSAALGIPYAYLSNDMIKANYSNARLALLEFRRRTEAWQHAVMVWQLCRQVWARWMDSAVLAGALAISDYERNRRQYLGCSWLPPKWDWVDPLKDAKAEIEQIAAGLKSRTQALAERGYDAEQVDAEIAADQAREQALQMFSVGYLGLEARGLVERLYWATCAKIRDVARKLPALPEELEGLESILSDIYFCNLSIFQSLPDSWAIDQLFPIMPIHRLDEKPTRNAVLADITCDSDGKIDHFVSLRETKRSLELHDLRGGEPYYVAVFLVGAYQETLGDLHNLFGDTHVVHIKLHDEGGWWIEETVKGDTAAEVLRYMRYDVDRLGPQLVRDCERAVREGRMSLAESQALRRFYHGELNGYTYLEPD